MALFKIPFQPIPQRFSIELAGVAYMLVNRWNTADGGGWAVDIYDAEERPILMNLPLVPGADLFDQFRHLGLPGSLIVYTDGDENAMPTLENLGTDSNVWLVT
jgi:hypothetical protein